MFGSRFFCLAFVFLIGILAGCAEPKYIRETSPDSKENGELESKATCGTTFKKSAMCLSWYWEKKPTNSVAGSLIFKTFRLNSFDQSPIEQDLGVIPQVILWMPGMGHGSTPTQTYQLDTGTYRVTDVFFIMPGEWDIRFQLKNQAEVMDEAKISLVF